MRILVAALVGAVAFASGVMLGYALDDESGAASVETALTAAVEETRSALLAAAEAGDYESLEELLPDGFEYTFGGPVDGGPLAYWQDLERTTGVAPLETLAAILKMPYVLTRGYYVWPWAYTVSSPSDLSAHEQELLAPIGRTGELFPEGVGYLGWRTGIAPDGTWTFFVAGD